MPEPRDQSSDAIVHSLIANATKPATMELASICCLAFAVGSLAHARTGTFTPAIVGGVIGSALWLVSAIRRRRRKQKTKDPRWLAMNEEMILEFAEKHDIAEAHAIRFIREAQGKQRQLQDKRHAENRAMKQMVVEWWTENKDRPGGLTKDAAAREMAQSLVPLPFRTIREWLKGL